MSRHADRNWELPEPLATWEQAQMAVLMDIRDRLDVLRCWEFKEIPSVLRRIGKNTRRSRLRVDPYARHRAALRRRKR